MTKMKLLGSTASIWLLLTVLAGAQAQTVPAPADHDEVAARGERVVEREHLRSEREAIETTLQQAEAACYQRFSVENCLSQARRHAREARAVIRQRELLLDGTERRERAVKRLSDVQERERTHVPSNPQPGAVRGRSSQGALDQQAAQRVEAQKEVLAAHQASQAVQTQVRADEAARARQKQEEKNQSAQQRRARVLQSQADRDAAGHKRPEPLPAVP